MKALVTASFCEEGLERLRRHMDVVHEPWTATGKIWRFDELAEKVQETGADALVVEVDLVHGEVWEEPTLSLVCAARADPLSISVDEATRQGVPVIFTPGRNAQAVADLTLGLSLALVRGLFPTLEEMHSGRYRPADPGDFMAKYDAMRGRELGGMTVGLVGLGAVGLEAAKRFRAFGSSIVAYDPFAPDEALASVEAERLELDELCARADLVSLHCPLNDKTLGLIGESQIARMKPDAYLVNTARASIVEDEPLYRALAGKTIAGAALDVSYSEPIDPDDRYLSLDNCLVTPHIGGATTDVVRHQSMMICDDVDRLFAGERPVNLANPDVWGHLHPAFGTQIRTMKVRGEDG